MSFTADQHNKDNNDNNSSNRRKSPVLSIEMIDCGYLRGFTLLTLVRYYLFEGFNVIRIIGMVVLVGSE